MERRAAGVAPAGGNQSLIVFAPTEFAEHMSSQLIMWNLVTVDGLFEGARKWDLDFHDHVWGDELQQFSLEQSRTADAVIFGRVTYEGMAAYWSMQKGETADFMNSVPKVVFSRTLSTADWNNTRLVRDDAVAEVKRMKKAGNGNLFVFGSADLSASLTDNHLFDEYRLCVVPVLLGAGTPLFKPSRTRTRMKLRESRTLQKGGVIMFLQPEGS